MVYEVRIAERAEEDLDLIFDYCSKNFSVETAERVLKGLGEKILKLEVFPEGYLNLDERIGQKLFSTGTVRMLSFKSYLIFFLVRPQRVDVLRVVSARTDYLNKLEMLFKVKLKDE